MQNLQTDPAAHGGATQSMPQISTTEETCTDPTASPLDSVVAVEADTAIMEAFIASLEEPSSAAAVTLCRQRCRIPADYTPISTFLGAIEAAANFAADKDPVCRRFSCRSLCRCK
ncbi:hypothetical protein GOP47_0015107 [Adiantum capillus-veneris]|uniref:Uncharacterized protein n=1 Tax=Adiantum capillus-veneris TaxID=13818 RepID=A0A9D4ZD22_ADICA|nr:hypothetical protein GOP47_0015107 [Adiantum capillus-veneris]